MAAQSVGIGPQEAVARRPDTAALGQGIAVMVVSPAFVFLEVKLQMVRTSQAHCTFVQTDREV